LAGEPGGLGREGDSGSGVHVRAGDALLHRLGERLGRRLGGRRGRSRPTGGEGCDQSEEEEPTVPGHGVSLSASISSRRFPNGSDTYVCGAPVGASSTTSNPAARSRSTSSASPRTRSAGWAFRAGRKSASTPTWILTESLSNHAPLRFASFGGFGRSGRPRRSE